MQASRTGSSPHTTVLAWTDRSNLSSTHPTIEPSVEKTEGHERELPATPKLGRSSRERGLCERGLRMSARVALGLW